MPKSAAHRLKASVVAVLTASSQPSAPMSPSKTRIPWRCSTLRHVGVESSQSGTLSSSHATSCRRLTADRRQHAVQPRRCLVGQLVAEHLRRIPLALTFAGSLSLATWVEALRPFISHVGSSGSCSGTIDRRASVGLRVARGHAHRAQPLMEAERRLGQPVFRRSHQATDRLPPAAGATSGHRCRSRGGSTRRTLTIDSGRRLPATLS